MKKISFFSFDLSNTFTFTTQISIEIWVFFLSLSLSHSSFSFSRQNLTLSQPWLLQAESNPSIFTGHNQISFSSPSPLLLFSPFSFAFLHFAFFLDHFVFACESSVAMPLFPLFWSETRCFQLHYVYLDPFLD